MRIDVVKCVLLSKQRKQAMFLTYIEKQIIGEVKMLKDLIKDTQENIEAAINWGDIVTHEEIEAMRADLASYEADLAAYN